MMSVLVMFALCGSLCTLRCYSLLAADRRNERYCQRNAPDLLWLNVVDRAVVNVRGAVAVVDVVAAAYAASYCCCQCL